MPEFTKYPIQYVFTTEQNNFKYISPQLKNILAFNRSPCKVIILHTIPESEFEQYSQPLVEEFAVCSEVEFAFHYIDQQGMLESGELPAYMHTPHYLRLLLPRYREYTGRALYLDLDLSCFGNLEVLFDAEKYPMHGKALAAVTDINNHFEKYNQKSIYTEEYNAALAQAGFGFKRDYFNSGVLLLDLDLLRSQSQDPKSNLWLEHLHDFDQGKPLRCHDQDFLNLVHLDNYQPLPVKFNYLVFYLIPQRYFLHNAGWDRFVVSTSSTPAQQKFAQVEQPVILHFIGKEKAFVHCHKEFVDYFNFFKQQTVAEVLAKPVTFYEQLATDFFVSFDYLKACNDYSLEAIGDVAVKEIGKLQRGKPYTCNPTLLNPFIIRTKTFYALVSRIFNGSKKRMVYAKKIYARNANFFAKYLPMRLQEDNNKILP